MQTPVMGATPRFLPNCTKGAKRSGETWGRGRPQPAALFSANQGGELPFKVERQLFDIFYLSDESLALERLRGFSANVSEALRQPFYDRVVSLSVENGKRQVARWALANGAAAAGRDNYGRSPLERALKAGDLKAVHLLLSAGANPDELMGNGNTLLIDAVRKGETAIAGMLLKYGADPNLSDSEDGRSPLMHLVLSRPAQVELIPLLVKAGANLDAVDSEGKTVLAYAAQQCSPPVVKELLKVGACTPFTSRDASNLLLKATSVGRAQVAAALLAEGLDPDIRAPESGNTPLILAAICGDTQTFGSVLAAGPDLHAINHKGWNALMHSLNEGNMAHVQMLLSRGAVLPPQFRRAVRSEGQGGYDESSALLQPISKGSLSVLEALLRLGMHPDLRMRNGKTALMFAVQYDRPDMVQALLDAGADPNAKDRDGATALLCAANIERPNAEAVVAALLNKGADPLLRSDLGESPLMAAAEDGNKRLVNQLLRGGAGWRINEWDNWGQTALFKATQGGHVSLVKRLMACGADPTIRDGQRQSLLLLAARSGHGELVRLFLEQGIFSVNETSHLGETALMAAVRAKHLAVVRVLLTCPDIDLTIQNRYGQSVMNISVDEEITQALRVRLNEGTPASPAT